MPWSKTDYPESWKDFSKPLLEKAIEIANRLVEEENIPESRAIPLSSEAARAWANSNDVPMNANKNYHIYFTEIGKWFIRREDSEEFHSEYTYKDEAIRKGKQLAKAEKVDLIIEGKSGKVIDKVSYRPDKVTR